MEYIFLSKYTKINENLENFRFIFNDKTSKLVFEEINKKKSYILDNNFKNSCDKFYISNKYVYMVYVLPKLLDLNIKNIKVYNENSFPRKLEMIENDLISLYNSFEIENDNFIITKKLVEKIKFGAMLAKKIIDKSLKFVSLETDIKEQIYEIAGAIKNLDKNIKIAIVGETKSPIKDLMTNPVDFVLIDRNNLNLLCNAIKNNNKFHKIKTLYFFDKDINVREVF